MNEIINNPSTTNKQTCIISKASILKVSMLHYDEFKNSYLCFDTTLDESDIQPYYRNQTRQFNNEILNTDSIWTSYAVHHNVGKIYCFEIPNSSLSVFEHIGLSKPLIDAVYYQNNREFLKSIIPTNLKIKFPEKIATNSSKVTMMFNDRRGKVLEHIIEPIPSCCDIFANKEDKKEQQKFIIEWLSRKINAGLQKNNLTRKEDLIVLTLNYDYVGDKINIYDVHFGLSYNMKEEVFNVIKNRNFSFI